MVLMFTLNISAGINGQIMSRVQHYKLLPTIGLALAAATLCVLAWQAQQIDLWRLEVLLALVGIGFGGTPPLAAAVLQNTVAVHHLGTAVGTQQFTRNLYGTILVALLGALVLIGTSTVGTDLSSTAPKLLYSAEGFVRAFYVAAASFAAALACLLWLEEKPLQTRHG